MVTIYMEGGGQERSLKDDCRRGLREFLLKLGLKGRMPRISACGSRLEAYKKYCISLSQNKPAILLVDSEDAVKPEHQEGDDSSHWLPWRHLAERVGDQWETPVNAAEKDCHLMVQVMETWFLADRDTLAAFFGKDFNAGGLPSESRSLEKISKTEVYQSLAKAIKSKGRSGYHKGNHSFKILARINPEKVVAACPWADRFVRELRERVG